MPCKIPVSKTRLEKGFAYSNQFIQDLATAGMKQRRKNEETDFAPEEFLILTGQGHPQKNGWLAHLIFHRIKPSLPHYSWGLSCWRLTGRGFGSRVAIVDKTESPTLIIEASSRAFTRGTLVVQRRVRLNYAHSGAGS